ncbi:MAG: hypothetical protein NDJ89_17370 [Oligoflexia bacterium]|nr:hypothetical protein [Oligoflexia bacterium]
MDSTTLILALLGILFIFVYVGYFFAGLSTRGSMPPLTRPRRFAGVAFVGLGLLALTAWAWLMIKGWRSFLAGGEGGGEGGAAFWLLLSHVASELLVCVSLILAGCSLLRNRQNAPVLLMISVSLIVATSTFAILLFGNQKHPAAMNLILLILLVVGGNLAGLVYVWARYVLRLGETR